MAHIFQAVRDGIHVAFDVCPEQLGQCPSLDPLQWVWDKGKGAAATHLHRHYAWTNSPLSIDALLAKVKAQEAKQRTASSEDLSTESGTLIKGLAI